MKNEFQVGDVVITRAGYLALVTAIRSKEQVDLQIIKREPKRHVRENDHSGVSYTTLDWTGFKVVTVEDLDCKCTIYYVTFCVNRDNTGEISFRHTVVETDAGGSQIGCESIHDEAIFKAIRRAVEEMSRAAVNIDRMKNRIQTMS